MVSEISLVDVSAAAPSPVSAVPPDLAEIPTVTLRFLLSSDGSNALDALRTARRSLLREELTRGRDIDEPSLEDAVFSPTEILWEVRPDHRPLCVEKLEELRRRANLLLTEADDQPLRARS